MRLKIRVLLLVIIPIVLLGGSLSIVFLPWATWYVLDPNATYRIFFTPKSIPEVMKNHSAQLLPGINETIIQYSQFVAIYSEGQSLIYIINPTLTGQILLPKITRQQGLNVQRLGPLLQISSSDNNPVLLTSSLLIKSYAKAIYHVPLDHLSFYPDLVANIPGNELNYSSNVNLTGDFQEHALNFYISSEKLSFTKTLNNTENNNEDLRIAIQSELLEYIPKELQDNLNQIIKEDLNFSYTQPNFINSLSDAEAFGVLYSPDKGFSLIYDGDQPEEFVQIAETWIQDEERYSRPTKRGFKTPDGILGYEIVPGEAEPVFHGWLSNCREPIDGKTNVWLCRQGNKVSLGSNESATRSALDLPVSDESWLIDIPQSILTQLHQSQACQGSADLITDALCQTNDLLIKYDNGSLQISTKF